MRSMKWVEWERELTRQLGGLRSWECNNCYLQMNVGSSGGYIHWLYGRKKKRSVCEIKLSSVIFVGTNYNSAQFGYNFYGWVLIFFEFYGLFLMLYRTICNTWREYKVHFLQNELLIVAEVVFYTEELSRKQFRTDRYNKKTNPWAQKWENREKGHIWSRSRANFTALQLIQAIERTTLRMIGVHTSRLFVPTESKFEATVNVS